MREIKFRAWVFDGLDEDSKPFMTNVVCLKRDFDQWIINWEEHNEWSNQSEYYLMQFTGLYDKNGKEIYEGDIVKKTMKRGYMLDRKVGQIKYIHDCFQVRYKGGMTDIIPAWLEVIGNIYENPELLKGEVNV